MNKNIPSKVKLFIVVYILSILILTIFKFFDPKVCAITMIPIMFLLVLPYESKLFKNRKQIKH